MNQMFAIFSLKNDAYLCLNQLQTKRTKVIMMIIQKISEKVCIHGWTR